MRARHPVLMQQPARKTQPIPIHFHHRVRQRHTMSGGRKARSQFMVVGQRIPKRSPAANATQGGRANSHACAQQEIHAPAFSQHKTSGPKRQKGRGVIQSIPNPLSWPGLIGRADRRRPGRLPVGSECVEKSGRYARFRIGNHVTFVTRHGLHLNQFADLWIRMQPRPANDKFNNHAIAAANTARKILTFFFGAKPHDDLIVRPACLA